MNDSRKRQAIRHYKDLYVWKKNDGCGSSQLFVGRGFPSADSGARPGLALNFKRITERIIKFSHLLRRQGTYKMRQLLLEHQGQKVTANSTFPRQTLLDSQHDFAPEPQDLSIGRGTNNSGDIFIFGDEIARNNYIKSWFIAPFW